MDKKLKAKWLKALRGGRYRQTRDHLKADGGYCCLGVLANIQGAKWKWEESEDDLCPTIAGQRAFNGGLLFPRHAGGLRKDTMNKLANMNDDGKSFKEIADYIEANL